MLDEVDPDPAIKTTPPLIVKMTLNQVKNPTPMHTPQTDNGATLITPCLTHWKEL